mmetsp:Transcript_10035/g.13254  ORF Transcript_10035/g.13254 Transcript_10035/m.13254 type:complete len:793 (+) Transcript_10035:138-2516(+)
MGDCGSKPAVAEGTALHEGPSGRFREPSVALKQAAPPAESEVVDDKQANHLKNVFAKKLDLDENFRPPVHHKTGKEKSFILKALQNNFVFEHLAPREMDPLIMAFEKYTSNEGQVVIEQGGTGDYFYILDQGTCSFIVDGVEVGRASKPGSSFGELALLYTAPRAATVTALNTPTKFYRVDQTTFRYILQNQTVEGSKAKTDLLRKTPFLADLGEEELNQMTAAMTPRPFKKGDFLFKKGEQGNFFYVIQEGSLKVTDIQVGDSKFADSTLGPGDYVGERALVTGEPRAANVKCTTDGLSFCIDKETFETVLGKLSDAILRSQDQRILGGIKVIQDSKFDQKTLLSLSRRFKDKELEKDQILFEEGASIDAAVYFPRGVCKLELTNKDGSRKEIIEAGGFLGDDQLLADVESGKNSSKDPTTIKAKYTVKVLEGGPCGTLQLAECRTVVDTRYIGKVKECGVKVLTDIGMNDLNRHAILGAGTFGQVWLVSMKKDKKKASAYALKIQSKHELVKDGQARAVIDEKTIMSQLQHPFIINLVATFQDKRFVYMLLGLVQGGELFSLLHSKTGDGVPEASAKFYAAGVADGLAFMHRLSIVYRDLKPENVLIDEAGYPVIVDFGFAKVVTDKTYTLCGTPLYLAPEVILNRGHNHGVDHWSLGVLIFEMISGDTPFYKNGMEQMDLFRSIVKGSFEIPSVMSPAAGRIVKDFLMKNPAKRLGSLVEREDGVYNHSFFEGLDWEELRSKTLTAPFKPKIKDALDTSNFDDWSHLQDKTLAKFPLLNAKDEKLFEKF